MRLRINFLQSEKIFGIVGRCELRGGRALGFCAPPQREPPCDILLAILRKERAEGDKETGAAWCGGSAGCFVKAVTARVVSYQQCAS